MSSPHMGQQTILLYIVLLLVHRKQKLKKIIITKLKKVSIEILFDLKVNNLNTFHFRPQC